MIYADFESILVPENDEKQNKNILLAVINCSIN